MNNTKLFESTFGPTTTIILVDVTRRGVQVKIVTNKSTLLDKVYPNSSPVKNIKVPRLQLPYSIIENTNGDVTTFKYVFGDKDISEIGINNRTHRVSFVGSFIDSNTGNTIDFQPDNDNCGCIKERGPIKERGTNGDIGGHEMGGHGTGGRSTNGPSGRITGGRNTNGPSGRGGTLKKIIKMSSLIKNLKNEDVYSFSYTGVDQSFIVPTNAKSVIVQCWGAGGGAQGYGSYPFYSTGFSGGGGYTKSELKNIAGQTVNIVVG